MLLLHCSFSTGLGFLVCILITKKFYVWPLKRPFHTKTEMNKPQAEGNANSHLYSRGRHWNKPFSCATILNCRRKGHSYAAFTCYRAAFHSSFRHALANFPKHFPSGESLPPFWSAFHFVKWTREVAPSILTRQLHNPQCNTIVTSPHIAFNLPHHKQLYDILIFFFNI